MGSSESIINAPLQLAGAILSPSVSVAKNGTTASYHDVVAGDVVVPVFGTHSTQKLRVSDASPSMRIPITGKPTDWLDADAFYAALAEAIVNLLDDARAVEKFAASVPGAGATTRIGVFNLIFEGLSYVIGPSPGEFISSVVSGTKGLPTSCTCQSQGATITVQKCFVAPGHMTRVTAAGTGEAVIIAALAGALLQGLARAPTASSLLAVRVNAETAVPARARDTLLVCATCFIIFTAAALGVLSH